ncbi:MAG: FAD-dependent oxidoreductase, partial [Actinomycetales bacterium]|nr:FAD-dependent oxidoreductase [Actinomycetales bacterium]
AIRQGAASVTQLDIRPQPPTERPDHHPWPMYPLIHRVGESHEEGGERVFGVNTLEVVTEDGAVTGVHIVDGERIDGRFDAYAGTERTIPADLVLVALGFTGPDPVVATGSPLPTTAKGTFVRDEQYATDLPGVFVAGDAGRGQSLIVWAIAEGRACAAAVDRFLTGDTTLPFPVRPTDAPIAI